MSPPQWVADAVFYAIVPDRFARRPSAAPVPWNDAAFAPWDSPPHSRTYLGGNLGGVTDRLDYLVDLGVTAIYLTPIFRSPSYHRYKPIDFFAVDPLLGGDAAFDELLAAAHRKGLRVVLDGVFNHVSWGFPPFLDVLENGERSPWKDWFLIEGWPLDPAAVPPQPLNYRCWNARPSMPELNHANPAVREYVLSVAEHWAKRGIDGWRFDCPAAVGDAAFWREMRARLKRINPDLYLLGEIWTDASQWLDGTQWDAATNYPLLSILHRFVGGERIREDRLSRGTSREPALDAHGGAQQLETLLRRQPWPLALAQYNFLSSADTPRFQTLFGGDAATLHLAALLLFTLPGTPSILYGEEVGLQGGPDPDNRRGFPPEAQWDRACLDHFRRLAALRRAHAALRRGEYRGVAAQRGALAFERTAPGARLLVAVNVGDAPASVPLGADGAKPPARRLFGSGRLDADGLELAPRSGVVFDVGV